MAYRIIGGRPLCGCVSASGSKNAALPILFATLLTKERVVLTGVPDIGDVRDACALLQAMGARVSSDLRMDCTRILRAKAETHLRYAVRRRRTIRRRTRQASPASILR